MGEKWQLVGQCRSETRREMQRFNLPIWKVKPVILFFFLSGFF
jgi:hypothetical protein